MIDFTFSDEQNLFRKAAHEFAETEIAPHVPKMEETSRDWEPVIKALGKGEMMAITIPTAYGGLGLGYVDRLIALEEIARVSVATAMMTQVCGLAIDGIIKFGTEDQKKKYLPKLATAESFATTAVTEPSGGSDPKGCGTSYKTRPFFYKKFPKVVELLIKKWTGLLCLMGGNALSQIHILLMFRLSWQSQKIRQILIQPLLSKRA